MATLSLNEGYVVAIKAYEVTRSKINYQFKSS